MKAFKVYWNDDYCVLIYALNRNRAKSMGLKAESSYDGSSYIRYLEVQAIRVPEMDKYSDKEQVFDCNEDLPDGVEFWDEKEI